MKSTTSRRRRCACGRLFVDKHGDQVQCVTCRPPWSREKAPPLPLEEQWRRWLYQQLQPYLGHETVKVNELIARLLGKPSKKKSAA